MWRQHRSSSGSSGSRQQPRSKCSSDRWCVGTHKRTNCGSNHSSSKSGKGVIRRILYLLQYYGDFRAWWKTRPVRSHSSACVSHKATAALSLSVRAPGGVRWHRWPQCPRRSRTHGSDSGGGHVVDVGLSLSLLLLLSRLRLSRAVVAEPASTAAVAPLPRRWAAIEQHLSTERFDSTRTSIHLVRILCGLGSYSVYLSV